MDGALIGCRSKGEAYGQARCCDYCVPRNEERLNECVDPNGS